MVKLVVAGMATVAVSAIGAAAMVPTRVVTANVLPIAAIDDSSSTIGFADSDLYFATPAQVDQQLDQMQALGVNNVRILIPWAGVEPFQGYYNWSTTDYMVQAADARGMGVLGVLNSTPTWAVNSGQPAISGAPASASAYGDFAGLVAQRYSGKVGAYEIWNEPNSSASYAPQPDPAGYTTLLKAAYPEIKAADPNATVIGGVVGAGVDFGTYAMNPVTFVKGIYAAGGEQYFDALSYHPYQYTTEFSQGGYLPDSPINQVAAIHDLMVANGDANKLIWSSEYGEPTSVASEADQAAYLQDELTTWRSLGYTGPSFVYTLQDRQTGSTDPEDTFGVIRSDGTLKPAAYVIQALASSPSTTATMARMALAMPDAAQAAPADLAALTKVAGPTTATAAATTAPVTPEVAAAQMATATAVASEAVAASAASLNPLAVAATTMAAAGQLATMTVQEAVAMAATALTPPSAATATGAVTAPAATAAAAAKVKPTTTAADPEAPKVTPAAAAKDVADATPAKVAKKAVADATKDAADAKKDAADATKDAADAPKDAADATKDAADAPKDAADAPKRSADSPKRSADRHDRSGSDRSNGDGQKPRHDRKH